MSLIKIFNGKKLAITGVCYAILMIAAGVLIGKNDVQGIACKLFEFLGIIGIFLGVFAGDLFLFPVPPDAFLLVGYTGGMNCINIVVVCGVSSWLAGISAALLGRWWKRSHIIEQNPKITKAVEQYGVKALLLTVITPLPYSIACWVAGYYKLPIKKIIAVALLRIPRFGIYLWLFNFGTMI